jgi:hypothetical protein
MAGFISLATTRPLASLCKRGRRGYGGNAPSFSSFSDATSELAPPARLPEWVIRDRCRRSFLPAHVRFAPKATKLQCGSELTPRANNRHHARHDPSPLPIG